MEELYSEACKLFFLGEKPFKILRYLLYAMQTKTLTIFAYYNVTIRYDITLLMMVFNVLPIVVGVWNFLTMLFSPLFKYKNETFLIFEQKVP